MSPFRHPLFQLAVWGVALVLLGVASSNIWVGMLGGARILNQAPQERKAYAIVLGAGVYGETLSGALLERMNKAMELFRAGLVQKILLSGDGTDVWYNETSAMRRFALRNNIPSEALFSDQEGFSTYASIERAASVFRVSSAYIISQDYHLARAVWMANVLGMDAWGIPSNSQGTSVYYKIREIPARSKDFIAVMLQISPRGRE